MIPVVLADITLHHDDGTWTAVNGKYSVKVVLAVDANELAVKQANNTSDKAFFVGRGAMPLRRTTWGHACGPHIRRPRPPRHGRPLVVGCAGTAGDGCPSGRPEKRSANVRYTSLSEPRFRQTGTRRRTVLNTFQGNG